MPALVAHKG